MTEPTPPLDDDLSALLDNEAAPQVAAAVEEDPASQARLAEFRRVREAVASMAVAPLADHVVDHLVATALAAADEGDPSTSDGPALIGPIASLDDQRTAKRQQPGWLVAAAVVALVAIGLGLVWSGTRDTGQTKFDAVGARVNDTTENPSALDSAAGSAAPQGEASKGAIPSTTSGATADTGTSASGPAALIDLGTFATTDALRADLKDSFPTSPPLSPTASAAFDSTTAHRCSDQAKALFSLDTEPSARGAAVVAGQRVVVFEFAYTTDDARATTLVVATTPDVCQPVLTFQR
ncbi:MAG: hypothetical protein ABIP03_11715 [Aquihabitans sp.]